MATLRRVLSWAIRGIFALILLAGAWSGRVLDLADKPDQFSKLQEIIGHVMTDPRVQFVTAWVVTAVSILNRWWVQAILIAAAGMLLLWGVRPFWHLRHRIGFAWRRLMEPEVWIDRASAIQLVENSKWARSRNTTKMSFLSLAMGHPLFDQEKFNRFCQLVLNGFGDANPQYIRDVDGKREYREDRLRAFLSAAYDSDVRKQFGEVPDIRV
jgi:hypothetical protein